MFLIYHVTLHDHMFKGCVLNGWKFLIVSHHWLKFFVLRPCDTESNIVYMTLQDHMIKGSGDFIEGNSSLYIPILLKLTAIDTELTDM